MNDGGNPAARVIFGPDGTLYGTTNTGGSGHYGTVFSLRPSATACKRALCPWMEDVLWGFGLSPDGGEPLYGDLIFDHAGDLYGTTPLGGDYLYGTVYELAPHPGGGWSEGITYNFGYSLSQGSEPYAGVTFDNLGNIYTTTIQGGSHGWGTVAQLVNSASGWTETDIHEFTNLSDGGSPVGGLIFDGAGNLYGASSGGGSGGGGVVFELSPSNGSWMFQVLYAFAGTGGPYASLTMDAAGNLYGTTIGDGAYGRGSVFKLAPSNDGWTYSSLHDFTGGSDGEDPISNVIFDASGNLYGTTQYGGTYGEGVVWEITP